MGIYSKYIFPLFLDWGLGTAEFGRYRQRALQAVNGETLEIGFGTGLNLPFYPAATTNLTVIDSENMLESRVKKRIAETAIPVARMQLDATGRLPFDDRTFDTVVTTLTLCSLQRVEPALAEIHRVLKDEGHFVFFEHGRSDDPGIARRQDRYNFIQRIVGAGCNMNRPIDRLIRSAGFEFTKIERFVMPKAPRILGEMYRGEAEKRFEI